MWLVVSGVISPRPSSLLNDLTVPKYFMVSSFVGRHRIGALR
jgi:hypothetical protein